MTLKHFVCLAVSLTFGSLTAAGLHLVQQQHPDIHEAALTENDDALAESVNARNGFQA